MKTHSLIIAGLLFISFTFFSACEEVGINQPPEEVKSAFDAKFPQASDMSWEEEDQNWEVEFKQEGQEMEAEFSSAGEWLETEWEIDPMELPANISTLIEQNYSEYEIDEAEKLERPDMTGYQVELTKGMEELEITFNESGEILSTDEENDDD